SSACNHRARRRTGPSRAERPSSKQRVNIIIAAGADAEVTPFTSTRSLFQFRSGLAPRQRHRDAIKRADIVNWLTCGVCNIEEYLSNESNSFTLVRRCRRRVVAFRKPEQRRQE